MKPLSGPGTDVSSDQLASHVLLTLTLFPTLLIVQHDFDGPQWTGHKVPPWATALTTLQQARIILYLTAPVGNLAPGLGHYLLSSGKKCRNNASHLLSVSSMSVLS